MNKNTGVLLGGLAFVAFAFIMTLTFGRYLNSSDLTYGYGDYINDIGINDNTVKILKNCKVSHDGEKYSGSECRNLGKDIYHIRICGSTVWCRVESNKVSEEKSNGCKPRIINNYHPRTYQAGSATVHFDHKDTLEYELSQVRQLGHVPNCFGS